LLPETSLKDEIFEVNFLKCIITFKEKIKRHCNNIHTCYATHSSIQKFKIHCNSYDNIIIKYHYSEPCK